MLGRAHVGRVEQMSSFLRGLALPCRVNSTRVRYFLLSFAEDPSILQRLLHVSLLLAVHDSSSKKDTVPTNSLKHWLNWRLLLIRGSVHEQSFGRVIHINVEKSVRQG